MKDQREPGVALCLCRFFLFFLSNLSACHHFFLAALVAAGSSLSGSDDVDAYFTAIFAARRAGAVLLAQSTTLALLNARSGKCVMRTALGRLGTIATHSDYHMPWTIPENTEKDNPLDGDRLSGRIYR